MTFKKTGKFTYFCNIHAGMKGTVTVKAKGKKVPSAKADKKALKRQVARGAEDRQDAAERRKPPANTVDVGVAGKHGEELFGFVPEHGHGPGRARR